MKHIFILLIVLSACMNTFAQGVKIGAAGNPDQHAILELDGSNGKGLLLPRVTTVQMNAMNAPDGMLIYNNTDASLYIRKNGAWQKIAEGNGSGGFSLPHASTHNLPGQYVFDLTNTGSGSGSGVFKAVHTGTGNGFASFSESGNAVVGNSNTGIGGYFSSLNGAAISTGSGNVGIGLVTPNKARLEVNGTVGAVSALFENGPGIAIENNWPGIGFNTYWNGGRRMVSDGYGAAINLDPATGEITLVTSPASGTKDVFNSFIPRVVISKEGYVGLGGDTNPHTTLSFSDVLGRKISLWSSNPNSNYGFGIQHKLLQMYTATEIDDIGFGYGTSESFTENVRFTGSGKVGIGTTTPDYPLTVVKEGNGIVHKGNTVEIGTAVTSLGGTLRTFTNHPLSFAAGTAASQMTLTTTGELGLGTALPLTKMHIRWNNSNVLQLDNTNSLGAGQSVKQVFRIGTHYTGSIGSTGTGSSSSRMSFFTGNEFFASSMTEKMSILDNGNVGINTVTPAAKLEVAGGSKFTGTAAVKGAVVENGLEVSGGIKIDGTITLSGPTKAAFKVTVGNSSVKSIEINHPMTNNDPFAMLFVTPNQYTPGMHIGYDDAVGRWKIYTSGSHITGFTTINIQRCSGTCVNTQILASDENFLPGGGSFNVLVIKQGS